MGEIETKARKSALPNAELASLEKDAQASGFVRIAARAKKAQAHILTKLNSRELSSAQQMWHNLVACFCPLLNEFSRDTNC